MSKLTACLSGALVTLAGVSGASAQTNSSSVSGLELEEVVVTAQKRETNLQKTPISIQVYNGEELKQQGKKRIDEIMNGIAGVNIQDSQVGNTFYMRGVESGGVAVLIDGVYQNRSETVRGGTLDMAQVEVSRGTQNTNLGANAIAGAVSIVSNQPVFEFQGSGSLEFGNYHLINKEGVVNVPLSDNQALRLAYSSNKRDGYISAGAGDSDLENMRLKYRWQASEDFDTVLTVSHQNIGGNGVQAGVLLATGHWVPAGILTYPDNSVDSSTATGFQADADTNPDTVNLYPTAGSCSPTIPATTAFAAGTTGIPLFTMGCPPLFTAVSDGLYWYDRENPWDDGYPAGIWPNHPFRDTNIDSVSADINWNTGIGKLTITPNLQRSTFESSEVARMTSWMGEDRVQKTRQIDVQLASPDDSRIQWLGGLYYYYTDQTGTFSNTYYPGVVGMSVTINGVAINTAGTNTYGDCSKTPLIPIGTYCYTWSNTAQSSRETKSAYGQLTYPVMDTLRLLGGLRYSVDKTFTRSSPDGWSNGNEFGATDPYIYSNVGGGKWSALTYRAGVEYDLTPESMLYSIYQTAYQPGSYDTMASRITNKYILEQFTLGAKNRFFDNMLQLNVELFNSVYKDRPLANNSALGTAVVGATTCGTANTLTTNDQLYNAFVNAAGTLACLNVRTSPTVPKQTSRGVDLDINFLPTSHDRIDLAIEYLKAIFDSNPEIYTPLPTAAQVLSNAGVTAPSAAQTTVATQVANLFAANVGAYEGLILQNAPTWSVNGSYQHEFDLPGGSKLTPRVNAYYKSKYWTSPGTGQGIVAVNAAMNSGAVLPFIQPSYSLFDASLGWQNSNGKIAVTGYIKNIENEPVLQNGGNDYVSLNAPRTWGLTINANF